MAKPAKQSKRRRALVVLGMHRAGTSALARVLNLCGATVPQTLMEPGADNPAGFWESRRVYELAEEILESAGMRWDDTGEFPASWFDSDRMAEYRQRLAELLTEEFGDSPLFVLKDPRLCRLVPLLKVSLRDVGAEPRYILPLRNPLEVAASLKSRDGFVPARSMLLWLRHVLDAERSTRRTKRAFVDYDELMLDWRAVVDRIGTTLGVAWPSLSTHTEAQIERFLSEDLRHHRAPPRTLEERSDVAERVKAVYRWGREAAAGGKPSPGIMNEARQWLIEADRLYMPIVKDTEVSLQERSARSEELELERNRYREELERSEAEREARARELEAEQGERERLAARVEELAADQEARAHELEEIKGDRDRLLWQLTELESEHERVTMELVNVRTERDRLSAAEQERETSDKRVLMLETELQRLQEQSQLEALQRDHALEKARDELRAARAESENRKNDIEQLRASTSWRVTAPIRALGAALRSIPATTIEKVSHRSLMLRKALLRPLRSGLSDEGRYLYRVVRRSYQLVPLPLPWKLRMKMRLGCPFGIGVPWAAGDHDFFARIGPDGLQKKTIQSAPEINELSPAKIAFPEVSEPELSIVIPVYGQLQMTLACLQALTGLIGERSFEVIVVDDASPDDTGEGLLAVSGIRYLRNEPNQGFIYTCNRGAQVARGRYLLLLNNDTLPQPGSLDALARTFEVHENVGLVGAKLLYADGSLQEAGGILWNDGSAWNYGRGDDPRKPEYNYVRDADYCSGAALVIPTSLWHELGGFDSYYKRAYYEDTDLAFRVRKAGYRVLYQPFARIVHLEGKTSGTDEGSGEKRFQVENGEKFFRRWQEELQQHRPNGVMPELERDRQAAGRVLLIDAVTPMPDQESGAVDVVNLIQMLHELKFKTAFVPQSNLAYFAEYTDRLQMMGTECLYHPYMQSLGEHLKVHGKCYDYVIIHRVAVFAETIDEVERYCPNAEIIFNTTDLHFLREGRQAELEGDENLKRHAHETRKVEVAMMRRAHKTIVVSSYESEMIARDHPDIAVYHLPLIRDIPGCARPFEERRDIAFIGGFRHPPNADAVRYFAEDIWPRIHAALPEVNFLIVGSQMPDEVKNLESVPGVRPVGFVEDLSAFLADVRLTVAPLRYGAGAKGKVASSMCHGVPVVGSPVAVEGMHCEHERQVLIARSVDHWVKHVTRAYTDADLWSSLSDKAIELMERNHSLISGRKCVQEILYGQRVGEVARGCTFAWGTGGAVDPDGWHSSYDECAQGDATRDKN